MTTQRLPLFAAYFFAAGCLLAQNYKIVSVNSGKVLDVQGAATGLGAPIQQWDWLGGANQQWQIVPQGSSWNSIVNLNSGKALDVTGISQDNGALI